MKKDSYQLQIFVGAIAEGTLVETFESVQPFHCIAIGDKYWPPRDKGADWFGTSEAPQYARVVDKAHAITSDDNGNLHCVFIGLRLD